MKKTRTKLISIVLSTIMICSSVLQPLTLMAAGYNPSAAVSWAYNNYKSSSELCAGFVSDCVMKGGGISIKKERTVGKLAGELQKAGFTPMKLTESSPGVMKYSANKDKLSNGDVLIWAVPDGWYNGKKTVYWLHAAMVTGKSAKDEILVTQTNGKVKDSTANYYYWKNKKKVCNYIVYSYHYTGTKVSVKEPSIQVTNVVGGKRVTIAADSGNTIYYSIDGASYKKYTGAFTLTENKSYKISAYAQNSSGVPSIYTTKSFSISKVAEPVISATKSGSEIHVSISDDTLGASIEYSINNGVWYTYKNMFKLSSSATVNARAKLSGYVNSDIASKSFTIDKPTAPQVNVKGGKNKVGIDDMVTFEWTKIANADYYNVNLTAPDGTTITKEMKGTAYAAKLSQVGIYKMQVDAVNGCGNASSEEVSVTVMPNVTVQFQDDEGNALSKVYEIPYGGSVEAPKAPTKEGHEFQKWDGSYKNVTQNTIIKAVFDIKTYTVTFKDSDGTVLCEQKKVPWNTKAVEPDMTGKAAEGYVFAGWNVDSKSECKDYKKVTGNMELYAVYCWENNDLPVKVTDFFVECVNNGTGQSYEASMNLICNPDNDTKGRVILVIETAKGTTVAVETQDVTLNKDSKQQVSMVINSTMEGTKASVYVVGLEDSKTGGAYSEKVTTDVTRKVFYSAWSDWIDLSSNGSVPEEDSDTQVETQTLYRYNTRKTATSTSSKIMSGYTHIGTNSSTGNWSSWQDSKVSAVNTAALYREVETRQVVTSTKYTYGHYCTGNISGAKYQTSYSNKTNNTTFNNNCKYHEIGTFASNSSLVTKCSDGTGYQYKPSGSSSIYRCSNTCYRFYRLKTIETKKTQYRYRDTTYVYTFEKISNFTDWSTTKPTSGTYFELDQKTQYRTRNVLSGTEEVVEKDTDPLSITGYVESNENLEGKKATVLIYKKTNTDPTESQIEYVDQIEIGADNKFAFTMRSRENISGETGDFVVSLAIEGAIRLVNVSIIEAPKPFYEVTFSCDGEIINTQMVYKNENAVLPEPKEISGKEFVRWDVSTSNVTQNLFVEAIYDNKQNVIVYVDYLNGTAEITYADYGSTIDRELPEAPEGYCFTGWDTVTVTKDQVVEALYEKQTYTVIFLDANGDELSKQTVSYGESAVPPDYSSLIAPVGVNILGWSRDSEWRFVKEDIVVSPNLAYAETACEPYLYENPENPDEVVLESVTQNATIYYTLDGSEPSLNVDIINTKAAQASTMVYSAPFTVSNGTTVRAIAVCDGMNHSETSIMTVTEEVEEYESVVGQELEEENTSKDTNVESEKTENRPSTETENSLPKESVKNPAKETVIQTKNVTYKVQDDEGTKVTVCKINNKKLTSVTIPANVKINNVTLKVTSIAAGAFKKCTKLKTVNIGKNITTIEKQAFYGCKKLTTIKGGSGLRTISNSAFYGCKALKNVILTSKYLTKIDANAFKNCTNLQKVIINSKRLTSIGKNAFYGDKKLANVTLKTTKLKTIGKSAFKKIKSNAKFKVPKKYITKYKRLLKKSGIGKKVKVTK